MTAAVLHAQSAHMQALAAGQPQLQVAVAQSYAHQQAAAHAVHMQQAMMAQQQQQQQSLQAQQLPSQVESTEQHKEGAGQADDVKSM
jgi:hypothetical protein